MILRGEECWTRTEEGCDYISREIYLQKPDEQIMLMGAESYQRKVALS